MTQYLSIRLSQHERKWKEPMRHHEIKMKLTETQQLSDPAMLQRLHHLKNFPIVHPILKFRDLKTWDLGYFGYLGISWDISDLHRWPTRCCENSPEDSKILHRNADEYSKQAASQRVQIRWFSSTLELFDFVPKMFRNVLSLFWFYFFWTFRASFPPLTAAQSEIMIMCMEPK